MIEFAQGRFYWGNKESDGASTQEHVEVAKKSAFAAAVIKEETFEDVPPEVDCPFELKHVWDWFVELDCTRQSGMGLGPITHTEISAWSTGMGINLMPIEREAIRAIDRAYLTHHNSKDKEKEKK